MKGSIRYRKDTGWWLIDWYDPAKKKTREISWYRGLRMYDKRLAEKLLAEMQGEIERGVFRIERYLGKGMWTDVLSFFEEWLETKKKKKPATYKGYNSYYGNWIKPFFEKNHIMMNEIGLDVLDKLLDSIELTGKGKLNVMMCFHSFLDYAWRSKKILEMPPFPKREDYGIVKPKIKWLSKAEFWKVIDHIPEKNRPPFLWLYYHYRRPGEACTLYKTDYDAINDVFVIQRALSARKEVRSTKTHKIHYVPCDAEFREIVIRLLNDNPDSPYLFVNPRARRDGGRYTLEALRNVWYGACDAAGVNRIWTYQGTKHTACTHFIEDGGTAGELKDLTDHSRLESVLPYAEIALTSMDRKRRLMERKNRFKKADHPQITRKR